ncbi:MAG: hypothetical protein K2I58_00295, partial [Candidatus Amulumruptor sp.]|nr:hypothetical protein [Candidatus Amulumruptor sp.]
MNFRCHITSLLALLTVSTTIVSAADRWTVHPVFSRPVTRAVETATDVYYLAGGSRVLPNQEGLNIPVDVAMA